MARIDLNSDLGESFGEWTLGDDAGVLEQVTSANIACGFHAGDPAGMLRTCALAIERGVVIGAHPGYRDLAGFGRRFIDYAPETLTAEVVYQIGALRAVAGAAGGVVGYVKPHGALYNTIARHEGQAAAVARAIVMTDASLPLVVPPGSAIERIARDHGLRTVVEGFADRGYRADGSLVPRSEAGALLSSDAAVAQAVRLATEGVATASDGTEIEIAPQTICLHGDTPTAVRLAAEIRAELRLAGVVVAGFVRTDGGAAGGRG